MQARTSLNLWIKSAHRALILNENEIVSSCKLDQMEEFNNLVLSKNPMHKIGDALMKVKSITKLSLSYCQLQGIDTSLKSCVELTEVRLVHNEVKNTESLSNPSSEIGIGGPLTWGDD